MKLKTRCRTQRAGLGKLNSKFKLPGSVRTANLPARIQRYLEACPPSISGQGGHDAAFKTACALVHGFALGENAAFSFLSQWNAHCQPPWSEGDLRHKIKSAMNAPSSKGHGYLLADGPRRILQARPEPTGAQRLAGRAATKLPEILDQFSTGPADYWERSPFSLFNEPRGDWWAFLALFAQNDVVWIGEKFDSGKPEHANNFRPVSQWLAEGECPIGPFVCPAIFKPGSISRSDENVLKRKFLVVESDTLGKAQICAIFNWLEQWLKLRAIVDTTGKSFHAWFDFPAPEIFDELLTILPALQCDKKLFGASQPVRFPGAIRPDTGKHQALLYLSL